MAKRFDLGSARRLRHGPASSMDLGGTVGQGNSAAVLLLLRLARAIVFVAHAEVVQSPQVFCEDIAVARRQTIGIDDPL